MTCRRSTQSLLKTVTKLARRMPQLSAIYRKQIPSSLKIARKPARKMPQLIMICRKPTLNSLTTLKIQKRLIIH